MTMRDPSTLTCREVVELVSDFLGDGLDAEERIALEQHLLVCPPCTLHVGQMRTTLDLTARLRAADKPAPVMDLFRQWKADRNK